MNKLYRGIVHAFKILVIVVTAIVPGLGPLSLITPAYATGNPLELTSVDSRYYQQLYTDDNSIPESLPSTTLSLEWNIVSHTNFDHYALAVGDTPGSITGILPTGGWLTTRNNSLTLTDLPSDGRDFYIRIFANNSSGYEVDSGQFSAKTYKFTSNTGGVVEVAANIIQPQDGTVLNTDSITVQWQDVGAQTYDLFVGTAQNKEAFATYTGIQTTQKLLDANLPTDGSLVYLTLRSNFAGSGALESQSTFSVDVSGPVVEPPVVDPALSPLQLTAPDSSFYQQQNTGDTSVPQQLPSTSLTLQWNPVVDSRLDHYALAIGDSVGSISGTLAGSGWFTTKTNSITIDNLPEDGRTFYVRIYANNSTGYEVDPAQYSATGYKFTAHVRNIVPLASQILQPQNNAVLSSKNVTVSWQEVDANSYDLLVGTAQNPSQFSAYTGLNGTQQLLNTNLPSDGSAILLTLKSYFDNNEVRVSNSNFSIDIPVSVGGNLTGIWANNGEDKVTKDELRFSNNPNSIVNSAWNGQQVQLFGAKNEVVAFNLVLEAGNTAAGNLNVTFDELTGPGNYRIGSAPYSGDKNTLFDWTNRDIELFYVRYLQIKGVSTLGYGQYDQRHTPLRLQRPHDARGWGTGYNWTDRPDHDKYYPDIAVPLELEQPFTIPSGENQSIWADIYIPKDAPAGIYQGQVKVNQNGNISFVPVQLEVKNFVLPDEPTSKTMLFISGEPDGQIQGRYGYTNSTLVDNYFLMAHRHKISLIDEGAGNNRPNDAWIPRLNGNLFTAQNGYKGPGVGVGNGVYSIGTYGAIAWAWNDNRDFSGSIYDWLDRGELQRHADAWQSWFNQNAPDVEHFVYLMDEPGGNYDKLQRWAQDIEQSSGPGSALMTLVTAGADTGRTQMPSVDISPTTFSVAPTDWGTKNTPFYKNDPGKRLYFYNGARPATGTFMTEDDGVALRTIPWTQYKEGIDRWFYWESTYYHNFNGSSQDEGNAPHTNLFTHAQTFGNQTQYDNSTDPEGGRGETGASQYTPIGNGDGVLFYPGTDVRHREESYGMNGPIASLRLKYWRRGIQDADYLALASAVDPQRVDQIIQEIIPKVLWEVGVEEPGASWKHTDISWSIDPDTWEAARLELAQIIESSNPGPVEPPVEVDADADGYSSTVDCNDNDASIHPGATEVLYDGVDNDCNPVTRDFLDADADGYNSQIDCNDNDASVHPGAIEIANNGKDEDCDPLTPDQQDVLAPTVTLQSPAALEQNVSVDVVPFITFSEAVDPATVNYTNLQLRRMSDDTVVFLNSLTLNSQNKVATFNTTLPLDYGVSYYFAVENVKDVAGNVLANSWTVANKSQHSFTVEAQSVPPPQDVSPVGLVGDYHFDFDLTDASPASHNATLSGNAYINPVFGHSQGSLTLDGNADYVKVPNSDDTNLGIYGQRSISLWFQAFDISKRQVLYEEGGTVRGLSLYIDSGKLYVAGWNTPTNESGWQGTYLSTAAIQSGVWHHVVLTLNGGTTLQAKALKGYVDGVLFEEGMGSQLWDHSGGIGVGAVNSDTLFHDGAKSGSGASSLLGSIDELKIYNRELDASEVALLHDQASDARLPFEVKNDPLSRTSLVMQLPFVIEGTYAWDYSGLGNNGELKNGVQVVQNGKYGESASFDGVDDYIHFKDSPLMNTAVQTARSISLVFNPSAVSSRQVLFEEGGTSRGLNIYIDAGHLYVGGWNEPTNESGWRGTFLDLGTITPGNWYSVVLTLQGGTTRTQDALRGYLNGSLRASGEGSQVWSHSGDIGVGATNNDTKFHDKNQSGTGTQPFSGYMDDVRVYNRVLTQPEISALFSL